MVFLVCAYLMSIINIFPDQRHALDGKIAGSL